MKKSSKIGFLYILALPLPLAAILAAKYFSIAPFYACSFGIVAGLALGFFFGHDHAIHTLIKLVRGRGARPGEEAEFIDRLYSKDP